MDRDLEQKLTEFQEWIATQPELPQNLGRNVQNNRLECALSCSVYSTENLLLLRFLKVSRGRLEKAQRLLRYSIELRQENLHIFGNRDPLSDEIQAVFKTM